IQILSVFGINAELRACIKIGTETIGKTAVGTRERCSSGGKGGFHIGEAYQGINRRLFTQREMSGQIKAKHPIQINGHGNLLAISIDSHAVVRDTEAEA